jgi:hypothetical protein
MKYLTIIFCLFLSPVVHADIYKCQSDSGQVTYTRTKPAPLSRDAVECEKLTRDNPASSKNSEIDSILKFQKNLKIGDYTSNGLVIDVKPPIAKVQIGDSERWYRIDTLKPRAE